MFVGTMGQREGRHGRQRPIGASNGQAVRHRYKHRWAALCDLLYGPSCFTWEATTIQTASVPTAAVPTNLDQSHRYGLLVFSLPGSR